MKKKVILRICMVSLLIIALQTTDVSGVQPIHSKPADHIPPIVSSPIDIWFEEGSTGYDLQWELQDNNPSHYYITKNEVVVKAMLWDNEYTAAIIILDGLTVGSYVYTVHACDDTQIITDSVVVTVTPVGTNMHTPFSIDGNVDFNNTVQMEGWAGNGTEVNPFVIENLFMKALLYCISIKNTDVFFTIKNCNFYKTGLDSGVGLNFENVRNAIIEDCSFMDIRIGSISASVSNCTWKNNVFHNVIDGLRLLESINCTISSNSFTNGGITLGGTEKSNWIHRIESNLIMGKPIGYYQSINSTDIDAACYGQIIVANCSNVNVFNGEFSDLYRAVSFAYSNFSEISNCDILGGNYGIMIERSSYTSINQCTIWYVTEVGVFLNETVQTDVFNCTISNIELIGIRTVQDSNTTIAATEITECGESGIVCIESTFCNLTGCIVGMNLNGINIIGCHSSSIVGNVISFSHADGLFLQGNCEGTRIIDNIFYQNEIENAWDDSTGSLWDDGISVGNWWSDYYGVGFYNIPGSRGGIDHYPQGNEVTHYLNLQDAPNESYLVGSPGQYIRWDAYATHPSTYTIIKDGILVRSNVWNGQGIIYYLGELSVGTYIYTITVYDDFNEYATDSVFVTVFSISLETNTTSLVPTANITSSAYLSPVSIIISTGSSIVIVIALVLIVKTRRSQV